MRRKIALAIALFFLFSGCVLVKVPPGQVKKHAAPGQVKKAPVPPPPGKIKVK